MRVYYWVANWNLARAQAATLLGNQVEDMVDCTHAAFDRVKECFPHVAVVAGYDTGSSDIRWTVNDWHEANVRRASNGVILHIDQSDQDLPSLSEVKEAEDIEAGAKKIDVAVEVARQRLARHLDAVLYVDQSTLPELERAVHAGGLPAGEIVAYQYASPSSRPHDLLPGTRQELGQAGADLSVVRRDYLAVAHPPGRALVAVTQEGHWTIQPAAGQRILTGQNAWAARVTTRNGAWGVESLPPERQ